MADNEIRLEFDGVEISGNNATFKWDNTKPCGEWTSLDSFNPEHFSSGTILWPEVKTTHYPQTVKPLSYHELMNYLNTKLTFEATLDDNGDVLSYTVKFENLAGEFEDKYTGLTQQLLEDCDLIELDEKTNKIMLGYIKGEIIGYCGLPHCIYLVKILE